MNKQSTALARKRIAVAALMALGAGSASALEFEFGDGWKGNWNTTLSAAGSWRMQDQDKGLVFAADGLVRGISGGLGGSRTDSGNLNYDKGDAFSQILKFTTDVSISKGASGGLLRVKGWYDNAVVNNNVPFGNQGQRPRWGYVPTNPPAPVPGTITPAPLGTEGLPVENRGQGAKLMDAYVYTGFDLGGMPAQVRLGSQVVNWGEALFLQGINYTSPIDLPALRRGAGTEIKEFLTPIPLIYGNLGLPGGMSLEAFYQLKWEPTAIDGCGSYFSVTEGLPHHKVGNCNIASAFGPNALTGAQAVAAGLYFQTVEGVKAKNSGQFGLALRFPVNAIDTEFGVYYQQLNARTPIISVKTGALNLPTTLYKPGVAADSVASFWEYPNSLKILGLTASTNIAGWSTGFELSYTKDLPAQLNGNDILQGFLAGSGPLGSAAAATTTRPIGTIFHGYDLFKKAQLQANAVQLFSNVLGAQNLTVIGELGFQWNNVPDYRNGGRRYGRGFIFGPGTHPATAGGANLCALGSAVNAQPDGCKNDGYITRFSYGTRLRGALTYNDVFGSGITATPSLFWAHDFEGVSIDSQFSEGRDTLAFGLKLDYNKKYALDLSYVTYANGAKWDPTRDRDFVSLALSVTF